MNRMYQPAFHIPLIDLHRRDNSRTATSGERANPGSQRGFGLVELMIALTISLFLLGGMFTIFLNTRQTYAVQTGLAQLQNKERLAMTLVASIIQSAGYYTSPNTRNAATALPAAGSYAAPGQSLFGVDGGSATAPDTVRVRFQTANNDGIMNCQGGVNITGDNTPAGYQTYDNVFTISASNLLQCAVGIRELGGVLGPPQPLVDSVTNLKVSYGIDTTGNGSASRYVTAGNVTDWSKVRSALVTLTIVNPFANQPGQPATVTFTEVIQLMYQP